MTIDIATQLMNLQVQINLMIKLKSFKSACVSHPLKIYQANLTIRAHNFFIKKVIKKEKKKEEEEKKFHDNDELEAFFILDS